MSQRVRTGEGESLVDAVWVSYSGSTSAALLSSVGQVEETVFAKRVLLLNGVESVAQHASQMLHKGENKCEHIHANWLDLPANLSRQMPLRFSARTP